MGLHLREGVSHDDLRLRLAAADRAPLPFQLLLHGAGASFDRPVRELVVGDAVLPATATEDEVAASVHRTLHMAEDALGASGHVGTVEVMLDDGASGSVTVTLGGTPVAVPLEGREIAPVLDTLLDRMVPPRLVTIPLLRSDSDPATVPDASDAGPRRGATYRRLVVPKEHGQQARSIAVRLSRAPEVRFALADVPPSISETTEDPTIGEADRPPGTSTRATSTTPPAVVDASPADLGATAAGSTADGTSAPVPVSPDVAGAPGTASGPAGPRPGGAARGADAAPPDPETVESNRRRLSALVESGLRLDPRLSVDDVAGAVVPSADPADWDPFLDAVVHHPVRGDIRAWANVYRFPPEDTMTDSSDDWMRVVGDIARTAGTWDRLTESRVVYEASGEIPAGIDLVLGGTRLRVEADVWGALIDLVAVARLCEALTPNGRATVHLPNHAAWVQPRRAESLSRLIGDY
ncbi:hypothetical protein [Georgenia sp. Z1491]|uniref:hypothetical protein n=1 Tax=Georgenia sp. Z1491 TaxID=3416707 RepID=UPI003CF957F7